MINERIPDSDIPGADPARVVAQYEPLIKKLANRYTSILDRSGAMGLDDLHQVGRIAVLQAQKKYNPDGGYSFWRYLQFIIRSYMRSALGIDPNTGAAPVPLVYLDEPLTDDEGNETARVDLIADPGILPFDEPMIDAETRDETAAEVHAALDRLKNTKQREVITRCWIEGQDKPAAAAEMGINVKALQNVDIEARHKLRCDKALQRYYFGLPSFQVGTKRFNTTWTSAVEMAVIWKEKYFPKEIARSE